MTAPSVFLGLFIFDSLMSGGLFQSSMASAGLVINFYNDYVVNSLKFFLHSFTTINFLILLTGLIFSYFYYYKKSFEIKIPNLIRDLVAKEYGFNSLSSHYIPKVQNFLTKYLWKTIDVSTIDDGLINNTSNIINTISNKVKKFQSGYIYHYSLVIISSLILLLIMIRIIF